MSLFGKVFMTLLISMLPVIELRGAIPIATAGGLSLPVAIATSILGNLLPVPFIILFAGRFFEWLRKKNAVWNRFVTWLETRVMRKSESVRRNAFWGLALFVAIPLPGTGAWTGSMIAAMLHIRPKQAFLSIALGVVTAGFIVAFVTYGAGALIVGGSAL